MPGLQQAQIVSCKPEMTLQQLAHKEDELYSAFTELGKLPDTKYRRDKLYEIFIEYRLVHKAYAEMASQDIEALKRGLFIQWYAVTEPGYLTGIGDIDIAAGNVIINILNNYLDNGSFDSELAWMLSYYCEWEWSFDYWLSFKGFAAFIGNGSNSQLPEQIDRKEMSKRGQMGRYWNSLTRYT